MNRHRPIAELFQPTTDTPPWADTTGPDRARTDRAGADAAEADEEVRFTPNPLRRQVADRLTLAGRRHLRHIQERRTLPRDRPVPHALLFFHHQPDPATPADPRRGEIRIIQRTFVHGQDVTDLHTVLATLTDRAREYHAAGVRHPLAHLVERAEPMTGDATYLGVGTSSINLDHLPEPGQPDSRGWPWHGLARLLDGTRLQLRGVSTIEPPRIASTHTLAEHDGPINVLDSLSPYRAWRWLHPDQPWTDPRDPPAPPAGVRVALAELHDLLAATERLRHRHRHRTTT